MDDARKLRRVLEAVYSGVQAAYFTSPQREKRRRAQLENVIRLIRPHLSTEQRLYGLNADDAEADEVAPPPAMPELPNDIIDKIITMAKKQEHAPVIEQLKAVHDGKEDVRGNRDSNGKRFMTELGIMCFHDKKLRSRRYGDAIGYENYHRYIWICSRNSGTENGFDGFAYNLRKRCGAPNESVYGTMTAIRWFIRKHFPNYKRVIRREGLPCLSRCDRRQLTRIAMKA